MIKDKDCFVMGLFAGGLILCLLMLALPAKQACEVSVMYLGGKVEVVRYGVVKSY